MVFLVSLGMLKVERASRQSLREKEIMVLYKIMIEAYSRTEKEIWGENYVRIPYDEFVALMDVGEIYYAQWDNQLVGSIHVFRQTSDQYSFGILSAEVTLKNRGIGRALIDCAEEVARENHSKTMQIEILRPEHFVLAEKEKLKSWYQRLGYELVSTQSFVDLKPDKAEKAKRLIVPTVFDVYRKQL